MPTTKCKIKFSAVLQSLCTAKLKNKSDTFIYTFSRILCSNFSFILTKDTACTYPLMSGGDERSHILEQAYSF